MTERTRAVAGSDSTVPDRVRARGLFGELAELPVDDPRRQRIRDELVELHLPLVEYLARRFRNRGERLDDLTQVATIGLIKSIDRFDLGARRRVLHLRHADDRRRDQAALPRQGLGGPGAPPAAGAQALADEGDQRALAAAGPRPDRGRAGHPPADDRGGGAGGPGVRQRLLHGVARRPRLRRRRRAGGRRLARHRRRVPGGRRVPRVAQAAARAAAAAREAHPAAPVLRQHDAVTDRRPSSASPRCTSPGCSPAPWRSSARASPPKTDRAVRAGQIVACGALGGRPLTSRR